MTSLAALQAGDPQRVGPYVLLGRLGSGGMGRVYLARSPGGRMVAVKVIRANLAEDAGFRARFAREVSAARKVGGLFTAQVVDADIDGPVPWLVTAYVPGTSLSNAVEQQGPLPDTSVLALAAGLAEGLIAIHAAGVIHRDLKPSNVLLAQDGPRIIDFGISSAAEATALTGTGFMIGSPGFMSPEQAEGLVVGPASDIFSLAGVLIYAARGDGPFGNGDTAALLYRVVHGKPNMDNVPENLRPLIKRSLSRDPKRRPTAAEFLAELSATYPSAADLTDWLPPRVLDPSAAGPAEPGGRSIAGGSAAGGFGADRFEPAWADPVPPGADPVAPMALAAEEEPATGGNATFDPPTRTTLSPQTPLPPTSVGPGPSVPDSYPGRQGNVGQPGYPPGSSGARGSRDSRATRDSRPTQGRRATLGRRDTRHSRATQHNRATQHSRATPHNRATRARRATRDSSNTQSRRDTGRDRATRSRPAGPVSPEVPPEGKVPRAARGGPDSLGPRPPVRGCPADRARPAPTSGTRRPPGRAVSASGPGG